jgi:hypothetical protein
MVAHPRSFLPLRQHLTGLGASLPGEKGALLLSRVAGMSFSLRFYGEITVVLARASKITMAESNASRRNPVAGFTRLQSRGHAVFAVKTCQTKPNRVP